MDHRYDVGGIAIFISLKFELTKDEEQVKYGFA